MRYRAWVALVLPLAACSGPAPVPQPQVFAPLNYDYLPPIVLKVATLNVVNNYVPSADEAALIAQDPEAPATALLAMLNHRLVASGTPGTGTVTVQTASINQVNGNFTGAMTVDVNVASADGRSTGFAEASVSASQTAPDPDSGQTPAALYAVTKQLMDDMNVQLQYQIQHNLGPFVSYSAAPGTAPLASGPAGVIQATPLPAPGSATPPPMPGGQAPPPPIAPVNTNPAVPTYLPGAGPAALTPPSTP
jgi:hypothetical protein